MLPLAGRYRPTTCLNSVLFPQPELPPTKNTSPGWMVKLRSRCNTRDPSAMVRSLTSRAGTPLPGCLCSISCTERLRPSETQGVEDRTQNTVGNQDRHNGPDDGPGCTRPDSVRAAL